MSDPVRFLVSFGQAVSTMALYDDGHPARERAVDRSYRCLRDLQQHDPLPRFSFLGEETIYQETALRDLGDWEWGTRLAQAGVQRMELDENVTREAYEEFLEEMMARITLSFIDSAEARPTRPSGIKVGTLGIRGDTRVLQEALAAEVPVATISYSLGEEAASIQSMHREVQDRGKLPLAEAEAVVRSLSMAMHGDQEMILPLLQLKEFDEYTTTHSLNVSGLSQGQQAGPRLRRVRRAADAASLPRCVGSGARAHLCRRAGGNGVRARSCHRFRTNGAESRGRNSNVPSRSGRRKRAAQASRRLTVRGGSRPHNAELRRYRRNLGCSARLVFVN